MNETTDLIEQEYAAIRRLIQLEDLSEKKARIFSRLLTDVTLAKQMETLAEKHAARKIALLSLVGKTKTGVKV